MAVASQLVSTTVTAVIMIGKQRIGQVEIDASFKGNQDQLKQAVMEVRRRCDQVARVC